jgi:hypothetical protein
VLRQETPGWVLLLLHLTSLAAPGPQPHHRRIAAAVMEDAAPRLGGQVFALANGDVAMLFRPKDGGAALAGLLARLFQAEQPDPAALCSLLPLPDQGLQALQLVRGAILAGAPGPPGESFATVREMAAVEEALRQAPLSALVTRQTAAWFRPGSDRQITPVFRELSISSAALMELVPGGDWVRTDPFLFGHMVLGLDRRMTGTLVGGGAERAAMIGGLGEAALHINMSVNTILSPEFGAVAEAMRAEGGTRLGIEVRYPEVFADATAFLLARERVRQAGLRLVLDGVEAGALSASAPWQLQPDMVKLVWSPALAEAGVRVRATVEALGEGRVVLHRADTEQALRWGLQHGIAVFQGHQVDLVAAADRMRGCTARRGCTVGECRNRAFGIGEALRAACGDLALLDAATAARLPA